MLKMPTRSPIGFKPFIFFLEGLRHCGTSWLMLEKHTQAARAFVQGLNEKA